LKGAFADSAAGPAVLLDHPIATFKKEQHLVIPVVDAERPAGGHLRQHETAETIL
jgi:hypothetical protein